MAQVETSNLHGLNGKDEPSSPFSSKELPLVIMPSLIYSMRVTKRFPLSYRKDASKSSSPVDFRDQENSKNFTEKREQIEINVNSINKSCASLATGFDFSGSGRFAVATAQNNILTIFDCVRGIVHKTIPFKEYGLGPVRFTHGSSHILIASDPSLADITPSIRKQEADDARLRYIPLSGDPSVRSFAGLDGPVIDLAVAPKEGYFVSASLDRSIRLWDLRKPLSVAGVQTPGKACVKFDPTGRVLAVADPDRPGITLYDIRRISDGGFLHFNPDVNTKSWTSIQFTNSGLHLILATAGSHHYVFDAFKGMPTHLPLERSGTCSLATGHELATTPNGRFVLSGTPDGSLDVWDLESSAGILREPGLQNEENYCRSRTPSPNHFSEVKFSGEQEQHSLRKFRPNHRLIGHSSDPITAVGFNPKYMTMATGGSTYALWEANLNNLFFFHENTLPYANASLSDYN